MDTGSYKKIESTGGQAVGRIKVDSRGRNVWQWNDDQLDSTSIMLQRLDNDALAIEPTRRVRKPRIRSAEKSRGAEAAARDDESVDPSELRIEQTLDVDMGDGFDPYNSS